MSTTAVADDFLAHYGKKGMKWGVRKSGSSDTKKSTSETKPKKVSADAADFIATKKKVKTEGIESLSNQELRNLTTRFDLEQRYSKVAGSSSDKTAVAKSFIKDVAKQQLKNAVNAAVAARVAKALAKAK